MANQLRWLKCKIAKGMFSDERVVILIPSGLSVFVPERDVRGDIDTEGEVRVRVFWKGEQSWAVLPSGDQISVPVDEGDLVAA